MEQQQYFTNGYDDDNDDYLKKQKNIALLPTIHNQETLATTYQRKKEKKENQIERNKDRKEKVNSLFKNANVFPINWTDKNMENNTDNIQLFDWIITFWHTYNIRIFFSIIFTVIFVSPLYYHYGPRGDIGNYLDPYLLINTAKLTDNIPYFESFDLLENDNKNLELWFQNSTEKGVGFTKIIDDEFKQGYFISEIYNEGQKNISFNLLEKMMKKSCPNNTCLCISSMHFGIPNNIILLNDRKHSDIHFIIDPFIESKSDTTFIAKYNERISINRPISIFIEYHNSNGEKSRDRFFYDEAACLIQCIEFYSKYKKIN